MIRSLPLGLLLVMALSLSCGRSHAPSPVVPEPTRPTTDTVTDFAPGQSIPAVFELQIDPATLSATSTPLVSRSGAGFQAAQFDLDITKFQTAAQFNVRSVEFTPLGDVEITFRHAHPWDSVDLAKPPSATNRADLGYTGRLLVLADVTPDDLPTHTFFGDVVANTELVCGADGFVQPGDLLAKTGFLANCFPYVLLADEAKDNRIGVSNNNVVTGNWDPAVGGWQRSNLGPNGDGWTGYDFVHAGQTIENSFVLNRDELTDGPITLQVALLIKYTEPKGVGGEAGRALRLPPETVDVLQFAYRAPHAALDGSVSEFRSDFVGQPRDYLHLQASAGRQADLFVHIRDWDQPAMEAPLPDISVSPDVALVEPGSSGPPTLEISCPSFWASPMSLELGSPQSATPGPADSELRYLGTVVNEFGGVVLTDRFALLRVTDPSPTDGEGSPRAGIDPQTLAPDPGRALDSKSYQALLIRLVHDEPNWAAHTVDPSSDNGAHPSIAILVNDPEDPSDDRLAVAYQDVGQKNVRIAIAQVLAPTQAGDWLVHTVDGSSNVGTGLRMIPYEDRLTMVFFDSGRGRLTCAQAKIASPESSADWTVSEVAPWGNWPLQATPLVDIDAEGGLVVFYVQWDGAGRYWLARTTRDTPAGPGDWLVAGEDTPLYGGGPRAAMHQGRLAMVTKMIGSSRDWVALANTPFPINLTDWDLHDPAGLNPRWPYNGGFGTLRSIGDRLVLQDVGKWALVSDPGQPSASNDWTFFEFGENLTFYGAGPEAVLSGDAVYLNSDLALTRSLLPVPHRGVDWQYLSPPLGDVPYDGSNHDFTLFQNRMVLAYRGTGANAHLQLLWNIEEW